MRILSGNPPQPEERTQMVRVQGDFTDAMAILAALQPNLDPNPPAPDPGSWWHYFWAH